MANCADKEVFLGFFGWFSARSDRLMWHQPNPGQKAVSSRKVWFRHLFSVFPPHFHPGTAPQGVAQGWHRGGTLFSVVLTPKLYSKHIVWHSPAQP